MKRFLLLLVSLFVILCSCADAEFYDESSAASDVSGEQERPQYMYAIIPTNFSNEFYNGTRDTLCRINLETGDALPICTEPACDHGTPWCTATNATYFDVTDDGSKVYFRVLDGGHGFGTQAGDGKDENILYEYDTATFTIRELDRMGYNDYNFTILAFDDGVVYNKYVVTETDETGKTLSYENTLCKYSEENGIEVLQVLEELWIYTRWGQFAYTLKPEHASLMNARMEEIATFAHDEKGTAERFRAMGAAYGYFSESDSDGTSRAYSLVYTEWEQYESVLLSSNVYKTSLLRDYILVMDKAGDSEKTVDMNGSQIPLSALTVRCLNPYTGSVLYTFDITEHLDELGFSAVSEICPAAGRGAQMRIENFQLFYAKCTDPETIDAPLVRIPFLFDAETGTVKPIKVAGV